MRHLIFLGKRECIEKIFFVSISFLYFVDARMEFIQPFRERYRFFVHARVHLNERRVSDGSPAASFCKIFQIFHQVNKIRINGAAMNYRPGINY